MIWLFSLHIEDNELIVNKLIILIENVNHAGGAQ